MSLFDKVWKGVLVCILLTIPAYLLGREFPIIGGPIFGILIGMILAYCKRPQSMEDGIKFTSKYGLQMSIILLGFGMNLYDVCNTGVDSLFIMVFTLSAVFITAYFVGKALKVEKNVKTLVGVGTGICGGSAIAATAPIIKASDKDVAFAISTIFLFNVIAVFLFPAIGHLLGMSDMEFGMWAGTAINDTSSVVAAGYTYSEAAGDYATIVKLTRTLMIIPITLFLAWWVARGEKESGLKNYSLKKTFPWFIIGFVAASIIVTSGVLPVDVTNALSEFGKIMIILALVAIGLNTKLNELIRNGVRPIVLGLCCWFVIALTSLICIFLM